MTVKQLVWKHSIDHFRRSNKSREFDSIERGIFAGFRAIGRADMPLKIKDFADETTTTRVWESDWVELGPDEETKFIVAFEAARSA